MIEKDLELYFHIPFCVRKCNYCDFLSAPADKNTQKSYMEALKKEVIERSREYSHYQMISIFFGGGTPSVVETEWIEELLEEIKKNYHLTKDAEITIEVNPGTVTFPQLLRYYQAGINRLSIGLQSVLDKELYRLGRIYTFSDFLETYAWARQAGFKNINLDIISALPKQSREDYLVTLETILKLKPLPEHISAYSLIIEEGTPFAEAEKRGELELPDEDSERWMYKKTRDILEQYGYCRYEISNYARRGYQCRHNCGYWKRVSYAGFGIGAASFIENTRFSNGRDIKKYIENPIGVRENIQVLTTKEQMEEFMFLGLRMTEGINKETFQQLFCMPIEGVYGDVILKNQQDGLLEEKGNQILLTSRGLDLANYVFAQFLQE